MLGRPMPFTTTTIQPQSQGVSYASTRRELSLSQRKGLSNDLAMGQDASISARKNLELNLQDWLDLVEMRVDSTMNEPWADASNVFAPIVPSQLDTAQAYIVARTLVPRFYIVSGNTEQAQEQAYLVERFYNADFKRQRGVGTWYDKHVSWLYLGLRDGTGIMEALWRRTKTKRKIRYKAPKVQDGVPVLDPTKSEPTPLFETVEDTVEETVYDDVDLQPVKLKDFGVSPATARTIEDAVRVWRVEWLYESDFKRMQRGETATFYQDAIDTCLAYNADGAASDVASDPQGSADKTAGGQIQPGANQGTHTSEFFKNRGPFKVFRIHSREFDMDGDGEAEENIFYYYEKTREMLGWMPYDYLTQDRPFFAFSPYPREESFAGYSLVERLAMLQGEYNKIFNDRNNAVDIKVNPPLFVPVGTELHDGEQQWAPGVRWEGEKDGKPEPINVADIPIASQQQSAEIMHLVEMVTGQGQPQLGTASSGRRTATENRQQAAATGTRNDLVAIRFRIACRALINFVHRLKLQYIEDDIKFNDQETVLKLPRATLAMDFNIDVSGATDPIDAVSRLNQDMGIYQLAIANPIVQGDPLKLYAWLRKICEAAGYTDMNTLIGTAQQITQQIQQAQAQAAAAGGAPGGQSPPHGGPPGQGSPPPGAQQAA